MLGHLGNIGGLNKSTKEMQSNIAKLQAELATRRYEGDAGGGVGRAMWGGTGSRGGGGGDVVRAMTSPTSPGRKRAGPLCDRWRGGLRRRRRPRPGGGRGWWELKQLMKCRLAWPSARPQTMAPGRSQTLAQLPNTLTQPVAGAMGRFLLPVPAKVLPIHGQSRRGDPAHGPRPRPRNHICQWPQFHATDPALAIRARIRHRPRLPISVHQLIHRPAKNPVYPGGLLRARRETTRARCPCHLWITPTHPDASRASRRLHSHSIVAGGLELMS